MAKKSPAPAKCPTETYQLDLPRLLLRAYFFLIYKTRTSFIPFKVTGLVCV